MTTTITLSAEDYQALLADQQTLVADQQWLAHQLRLVTVKRDLFKQRINELLHCLYAAKSEAVEVSDHSRKKRGRKLLDPLLPREMVRHELPEAESVYAHDDHMLVKIGADISEQLDIVPQQIRVIQHQRIKYACPCCDNSILVTPPARMIPMGLLSRFGGDRSRTILAASMVRVGRAAQPIINLLRNHQLEADLILGDKTVVQVALLHKSCFVPIDQGNIEPPTAETTTSP